MVQENKQAGRPCRCTLHTLSERDQLAGHAELRPCAHGMSTMASTSLLLLLAATILHSDMAWLATYICKAASAHEAEPRPKHARILQRPQAWHSQSNIRHKRLYSKRMAHLRGSGEARSHAALRRFLAWHAEQQPQVGHIDATRWLEHGAVRLRQALHAQVSHVLG